MIRNFLAAAALIAVGALAFHGVARAGDDAPKAPALDAKPAVTSTTPKTDDCKNDCKSQSPICVMMGWVAKKVAPNLECACPGTPEGEKAWRGWFAGGKDVRLAELRDTLVAQGWTADRTIAYFKEMAAKMKAGECCEGDDKECTQKDKECCQGKGERTDGKPCCRKCPEAPKNDPAK